MPAGTCICRRCENERIALAIFAVWTLDKLLTLAVLPQRLRGGCVCGAIFTPPDMVPKHLLECLARDSY